MNIDDLKEISASMVVGVVLIFVASLGLASLYELVVGIAPDMQTTTAITCLVLIVAWVCKHC